MIGCRSSRMRKLFQYLGAVLVFGTLAVVAARFGYNVWQQVAVSRARAANRQPMVEALRRAGTPDQLNTAVSPDGVVLRISDGSWIAIAYVGSDRLPRSVAHDSGGKWLESDRRFGNALGHYHLWQSPRALARAGQNPDWSEADFLAIGINRDLDQIERSTDLTQARQRLGQLGFEEFTP